MQLFDFAGHRILITGAGSGFGRATAVLLSRLGAQIVLAGRSAGKLEQTLGQLEGAGHEAAPFDLSQCSDTPAWLKKLSESGGPFNGIAHFAGMHSARPLRMLDAAHFDEVMRTNAGSAMALARAFRQKGCNAPPASLVLTASVAALTGAAGVAAYSASKGAIVSLTRSLALELAREGLRVNCLAPGFVLTEMTAGLKEKLPPDQFAAIEAMHPLGLGTPEDIAAAAAFLLSASSRWITGTTLVVDGGYTAH